MSEEQKEVAAAEESRGAAKTDQFKIHLQKIIKDVTGKTVSKSTAWKLFKEIIGGTVQFVEKQELETSDNPDELGSRRLPLAGVGSFEIVNTKPRGTKAGFRKTENGELVKDESLKVWPFVPRFRFYPSSKISDRIEQTLGLEDHGLEIENFGIFRPEAPAEAPAPEAAPEVE
jgi:hypothetical protein